MPQGRGGGEGRGHFAPWENMLDITRSTTKQSGNLTHYWQAAAPAGRLQSGKPMRPRKLGPISLYPVALGPTPIANKSKVLGSSSKDFSLWHLLHHSTTTPTHATCISNIDLISITHFEINVFGLQQSVRGRKCGLFEARARVIEMVSMCNAYSAGLPTSISD